MSTTYQGAIVQLLVSLALLAGVDLPDKDIETTVGVVAAFVAAGITLYGRWKAGGVKWSGFKK